MEPNGPARRANDAELALIAYNAYAESVGGKAFNGDDLPAFPDVPERIQDAWISAVQSVRIEILGR